MTAHAELIDGLRSEARQQETDPPANGFELDRRDFLKTLGGGLLATLAGPSLIAQESGRGFGGHELPTDLSAWIHISASGKVTVFTGKVEVGQNIRTSLAQLVAEELRVPFDSIEMIMGDTDLTPWDMGTFGSRTTPTMGPQLCNMASAARELLVKTAAARWGADSSALTAANGRVTNPQTKQTLTYGEITRGEKFDENVGDPPLTPATEWKIAGTPVHKALGRDFVTGKHQYPSDILRPEMLYGKVVRPVGFKASLVSVDAAGVDKIAGAKFVHDGDFMGVAAGDLHSAEQAVRAVQAKWSVPAQISNTELFETLKKGNTREGDGKPEFAAGSVAKAMETADVKLEQHYTVQYIAHTPLEPRAAVAEWTDGKLTVWTGTQRPFGVRDELMEAFHLPVSKVRVIQPDMGSGYGGKHSGEAAIEAARLAKATGKPVKVIWSREEEFTWAYFRPAGWIEVRSGARRDGTLVAWEHHNWNSGPAAIQTPYKVENQLIQFHPSDGPLRQGSYRGLAATANHFAREAHMDEMAHAVGMDPLDFRFKNLADERLRTVFQAAAEKFGWGKQKSTSEFGFGIAGGIDKGGRIACCVEVEVSTEKKIRLRRVVEAWESGAVVNPDGLHNQTMGACVMAIGGAMFEAIEFDNGRIMNPHLAQYRVPRFSDVPEIEVVLIDRKDLPSAGAGETGLVGLAPAISNAVFAATGTRLRSMPMAPEKGIPGDATPVFRS